MSKGRYYVKSFKSLHTPLHQIWDRETGRPVNPLWFYAKREEAQEKIDRYEADLSQE